MIASHYVVKDIERTFESGNLDKTGEIFDKFSKRYHKDLELQKIYAEFQEYLINKDKEKLEHIKSRLHELQSIRKFETGGAHGLPLKDRRHFTARTKLEFEDY